MKKYVILMCAIGVMLFTTGCEKTSTLNCTKTETDDDGYKTTETIVVTSKNDKVSKVEQTSIQEMDADLVDTTISFGETFSSAFNDIDGMDMTYSKESDNSIKTTMSVDFAKLDMEKLKEAFGSDLTDDSFYSSKDMTLEEFKKENLDGYTCN